MSLFRFIPTAEAATGSATADVTRQADPSTMDKYKEMLDFSSNTRYAGRLWSDKTVFALGYNDNKDPDWNGSTLTLKKADDGVDGSISLDEDFLHVYSVLGSSQQVNEPAPVDLVLALDISGSMGSPVQNESSGWVNTVDQKDQGTWGNGLGYYTGTDNTTDPLETDKEDDNGIPDAIVAVFPRGQPYTTTTSGQMAADTLTAYNTYLTFCNALINAIDKNNVADVGVISADEAGNITNDLIADRSFNLDTYMDASHRGAENYQKLYDAYLAYKADLDTLHGEGKNPWLSNPTEGSEGRNASWPSADWKKAFSEATGKSEPLCPMLNAPQAPNRMFYVIQSANEFISSFLSLNDQNRISVVVYDSVATVLMPLAHYEKDGEKDFLSAQKHHWQSWSEGQWACTVTATAKPTTGWAPAENLKVGETYTASVTSWGNTNTEAAVTAGLDILAQSYDSYNDLLVRLPMLVLMTDGAANAILTGAKAAMVHDESYSKAWTNGAQTSKTTEDMADRYNDADGMVLQDYSTESATAHRTYDIMKAAEAFQDKTSLGLTVYGAKDGHVYGAESDFPTRYTVLLHTLMSIAFQKTLVEKHYNEKRDLADDPTESLIYTIGFGLDSYSESVQAICSELLDPATTFGTTGEILGEESSAKEQRLQMNKDYEKWLEGGADPIDRIFKASSTYSSLTGGENPLNAGNLHFPIAPSDLEGTTVTQADIAKNIRYNKEYFEASLIGDGSDNQSLQDVFRQILEMIQGVMFTPWPARMTWA